MSLAGDAASARRDALIVYVLPEAWQIADLPLDPASAERQAETRGSGTR